MNLKNTIVNKLTTLKDGAVKIELITRELPPQELAELFYSVNKEVVHIEIPDEIEGEKTKAQRLRAVLYKVWETNSTIHDKFSTFALYYDHRMEQIIESHKEYIL